MADDALKNSIYGVAVIFQTLGILTGITSILETHGALYLELFNASSRAL